MEEPLLPMVLGGLCVFAAPVLLALGLGVL